MKMDKKEDIQNIQEQMDRLESCYLKGMLSDDELLRRKSILDHELSIILSKKGNEKDHNSFGNGSMYVFKGLKSLESLIREKDPKGKQYTFQIPFTDSGKRIWKDLYFEVRHVKPGENNWQGWTVFDGFGRFSVYSGEGTLIVREEKEMIQSVLYQKCYRDHFE